MGCPLCTREGSVLILSAFAILIISVWVQWLLPVGVILVVAAYVVPFVIAYRNRNRGDVGSECTGVLCRSKVTRDDR